MNFLEKLEKRIESSVDNTVAKLFGGKLIIADLIMALKKEADLFTQNRVSGSISPDYYIIAVNMADNVNNCLTNVRTQNILTSTLTKYLEDNSRSIYKNIIIELKVDSKLESGQMKIASQISNQSNLTSSQLLDSTNITYANEKIITYPQLTLINLTHENPVKLITSEKFVIKEYPIVIGRSNSAQLRLPHPKISRFHAKLTFIDHNVFITDLNSTNGTFVNGNQISRVYLSTGDKITIGNFNFECELENSFK